MSDQVVNQNVGFLMTRLKCWFESYLINSVYSYLVFATQVMNMHVLLFKNSKVNTVAIMFSEEYAWANSADPDRTAPTGAVRSGSSLFAIPFAPFG